MRDDSEPRWPKVVAIVSMVTIAMVVLGFVVVLRFFKGTTTVDCTQGYHHPGGDVSRCVRD